MIRLTSWSRFVGASILCGLSVVAANGQAKTSADVVLTKLQHDWAEARKLADMAFLESFYAKEFTVGDMDGSESTREMDLSMFSSGDLKPAVIPGRRLLHGASLRLD